MALKSGFQGSDGPAGRFGVASLSYDSLAKSVFDTYSAAKKFFKRIKCFTILKKCTNIARWAQESTMLTKDQGPRTKDQGPRTKDQGPRTKDQANAAAEAILAEANRDRIKNIPPVSWLFRCPELTALAPGQRLAVVTQAKKNVRKKPLLIAALLIWIAAHGLAWITRWDGAYHDLFQVIGLGGRVFVIILGMYLVRREARLLARNMRC